MLRSRHASFEAGICSFGSTRRVGLKAAEIDEAFGRPTAAAWADFPG